MNTAATAANLPLAQATEALHERARALTGLHDFGDDEYLTGLEVLVRSLGEDGNFSSTGRLTAIGLVVTALAGRLESEAGWNRRPSSRTDPIEAPTVIVGLPQTGTTMLHKMWARVDPLQGPELWLLQHPMPRPPRVTWESLPAYPQCEQTLRVQQENSPATINVRMNSTSVGTYFGRASRA